jgi:hypothetical protein
MAPNSAHTAVCNSTLSSSLERRGDQIELTPTATVPHGQAWISNSPNSILRLSVPAPAFIPQITCQHAQIRSVLLHDTTGSLPRESHSVKAVSLSPPKVLQASTGFLLPTALLLYLVSSNLALSNRYKYGGQATRGCFSSPHSLSMSTDATVPTTVGPTFAQLFGPVFWGARLLYSYLTNESSLN